MKILKLFACIFAAITTLTGCVYTSVTVLVDSNDRAFPLESGAYLGFKSLSAESIGLTSEEIKKNTSQIEQAMLLSKTYTPAIPEKGNPLFIKKHQNSYQILIDKEDSDDRLLKRIKFLVFEKIQNQTYLMEMQADMEGMELDQVKGISDKGEIAPNDSCGIKGQIRLCYYYFGNVKNNHLYLLDYHNKNLEDDFKQWALSLNTIDRWRYGVKVLKEKDSDETIELSNSKALKAFYLKNTHNFTIKEPIYVLASDTSIYKDKMELHYKLRTLKKRLESEKLKKIERNKKIAGQFAKAESYRKEKKFAEAFNWYLKAAEMGHKDSQYHLGELYYYGQGTPKSYADAAKWYRKASAQGHSGALFSLGYLYDTGKGVSKNETKAFELFRKAADQGHELAQFQMALCYQYGSGVPKNMAEAFKWYMKGATQGREYSQYMVGKFYNEGKGVSQSYKDAAIWFRKAADQGHADAQYMLGSLYEKGQGILKNKVEAIKWYKKAANNKKDGTFKGSAKEGFERLSTPQNRLLNLDGYFYVTKNMIFQYRLKEKDQSGAQMVYCYVVTNKGRTLPSGQLIGGGWWYPSYQQMKFTQYLYFRDKPQCSGWWDRSASWSGVLVADNNIPMMSGQSCSGFSFSGKNYPLSRKPEDYVCGRVETNSYCNIECVKWMNSNSFKGYLVRAREDAYSVYRYLSYYGY